jgi:AraC-like DNA-binding protein
VSAGTGGHAAASTPAIQSTMVTSPHLPWIDAFVKVFPGSDAGVALNEVGGMILSVPRVGEELVRRLWIELALRGPEGVLNVIERIRGEGPDGPPATVIAAPCNAVLIRALRYMDGSLGSPDLTIDRIADASGVSRRWLSHLFRLHWRLSVKGMVHALRVYRAAEALRSSRMSTKEIAAQVGYQRTSDLDAHFRRRTGMTPTSYRRASSLQQAALLVGLASPVRGRPASARWGYDHTHWHHRARLKSSVST